MKTDLDIKKDVLEELAWQPNVDETQIGVVVENGTVMLTGIVSDYQKKVAAEKAAKSVKGVKAFAEDIQVKYGTNYQKTDLEISKAIVAAFEWNTAIPEDKIIIEVSDGFVDLSGEVEFAYQRDAAKRVTENIIGVKYINNIITIKEIITSLDVKQKIMDAFKRSATIEGEGITVEITENIIKLKGKVYSLKEKIAAENTAYFLHGIHSVENELVVVD